ncbi:MAG: hypothetical protein K6E68_10005 [Lachnospiraceae bacterium]|nr:hypothetical protein [Lachnospiraceae bacterium]
MTMYAIPIMREAYPQEVAIVDSTTHYQRWDRNRERDREERKKKDKNQFQSILDKEKEKELGQVGCFFELRA